MSGQLRILFAILASTETPPKPNLTVDEVWLSDDVSFTITNEDTKQSIVVSNPTIDQDPAFSYARFNEQGEMGEHQLGILIPYTLKPGRYRVTNVTGKVWYPSSGGGKSSEPLRISGGDDTSFTIAAPTPTPTATPTATPVPTPKVQIRGSIEYMENMAQENLILHIGEGIFGFDTSFFKSVSIDGTLLDSADYNVANGSILLTVHKDYLNRLKSGRHTVSVALRGAYDGQVLKSARDGRQLVACAVAGGLSGLRGGGRAAAQKAERAVKWRRTRRSFGDKVGISAFYRKFFLTSPRPVKYTIIAFAWNNVPPAAARFYICSNSPDDRSV